MTEYEQGWALEHTGLAVLAANECGWRLRKGWQKDVWQWMVWMVAGRGERC